MKIKHIVCLIIGILILLLVIKAITQPDEAKQIITDAVYLESPVILPENEGKNVIISGNVEMTKSCYDDELNISFNTPFVARMYEVEEQNQDGDYCWNSKSTEYFYGEAVLGEFHLDCNMLSLLPISNDYRDFDKKELAPYTTEKHFDTTYIMLGYNKRCYYVHCDLEENGEMTLLGRQKGNTIEVVYVPVAVSEGIVSKDRLLAENKASLIFGLFIGIAAGLGLSIYGIYGIILKIKGKANE